LHQLVAVFFLGILMILFRSFTIQVIDRSPWIEKAAQQHQKRIPMPAERGQIYDRNLDVLAMDQTVYHLAFDQRLIADVNAAADVLADILGGSPKQYLDLIQKSDGKRFVYVKRGLTDLELRRLTEEKIEGLILEKEPRRIRPYGTLARQVIGVIDSRQKSIGGVEQACDRYLRGADGWAFYQRDAHNQSFSSLELPSEPPTDGHHLVLTLDHACQSILEEELQNGIKTYKAQNGCAVMMDPYTGEIIAMATVWANRPDTDKLSYEEYVENRAVQWDFEPGSTFKIVAAAAALEERLFESNALIYCEKGVYRVGSHTIHDRNERYEWLTFSEVMELSSNIGMVKIAKKMGKEKLCQYVRNFGFGTRTGIDLPREVPGILAPVYRWDDFGTATIAFGQGLSVSALQMACMTAVVANGGELVKPYLIRSILRTDGSVHLTGRPKVIRRVISEKTSAELRVILEKTVSRGLGRLAAVDGVSVAGKTGTAEKSSPGVRGYTPGIHVSSFVGFWPADVPQYVLVVVLDEPREQYWASRSAAPIFSRMVDRIVSLPVRPRYHESEPVRKRRDRLFAFTSAPVSGSGTRSPEAGGYYPAALESRAVSEYHVPNLIGMSLREAMKLCGSGGIAVEAEGSGRVISQEPRAGTRINPGLVCRIRCGP